MPPSRSDGIASSAPTIAANTTPTTSESSGEPRLSASCAVVKPPTAANVAWHSEIWPAIPVITVIERKITANTTASVTMPSQIRRRAR